MYTLGIRPCFLAPAILQQNILLEKSGRWMNPVAMLPSRTSATSLLNTSIRTLWYIFKVGIYAPNKLTPVFRGL